MNVCKRLYWAGLGLPFLFVGCLGEKVEQENAASVVGAVVNADLEEDFDPTTPALAPGVVVVRRDPGPNSVGLCSGVLISPEWVLTGAHCLVDNYPATGARVYAGERVFVATIESSGTSVSVDPDAELITAVECRVHPSRNAQYIEGGPTEQCGLLTADQRNATITDPTDNLAGSDVALLRLRTPFRWYQAGREQEFIFHSIPTDAERTALSTPTVAGLEG